MVFEHIRKLQQEYTDKFVVVDEQRPELRRFQGLTGTVKTVNFTGKALVEFAGNKNIGWYDIDIDYLKVVDQPVAPPESTEPAAPAAKSSEKGAATKAAPTKAEPKDTPAKDVTPEEAPKATEEKTSADDTRAAASEGKKSAPEDKKEEEGEKQREGEGESR